MQRQALEQEGQGRFLRVILEQVDVEIVEVDLRMLTAKPCNTGMHRAARRATGRAHHDHGRALACAIIEQRLELVEAGHGPE
ncbi:hypothetical protein B8W70_25200 [Pseudomonas sp. 1239]|nr:hypothetical protein B8W70_25200 [Pseudomonas sp. 1239]